MMKCGGFSPCDIPLRQKMIYEAYMQMKPDAPEPQYVIENLTLLNNKTNSEANLSPSGEGVQLVLKDEESAAYLSIPGQKDKSGM
jgi:hypothetical protein